ncbi:MAG: hypothetical protein KDC12_02620 [Flavobacteriales bacterium]|nr:hypothetical protein [Flavobacteriales bacterium]
MMTTRNLRIALIAAAISAFSLQSCSDGASDSNKDTQSLPPDSVADATHEEEGGLSGSVVKYKGELFSIPSPIQTALLIKKSNLPYNEKLLNPTGNKSKYVSQFQKALNMGVYGADLAYLSNFDNTATSIEYFTTVEGLADELGIKNNIDPSIISRFHASSDVQDSLYVLNAELYREVNQYLKDNERNEAASLILAGGWIEALHIALDVASKNDEIRLRIGEQRSALTSLVTLLSRFEDQKVQQVKDGLAGVLNVFDNMKYSYEYVDPITDASEHTTYINCKSSVEVSMNDIDQIRQKLAEIRNIIIS